MPDSRIPKMLLYGQLKEGQRGLGRPLLRFKDTLKANLRNCNTDAANWEDTAADRERWRHQVTRGTQSFEQTRADSIQDKRYRRKRGPLTSTLDKIPCSVCGRLCVPGIGLCSHMRSNAKRK